MAAATATTAATDPKKDDGRPEHHQTDCAVTTAPSSSSSSSSPPSRRRRSSSKSDAASSSTENTRKESLGGAVARSLLGSLAFFFRLPIRLFRPVKLSSWTVLESFARRERKTLSLRYLVGLIRRERNSFLFHLLGPPIVFNTLVGFTLFESYSLCEARLLRKRRERRGNSEHVQDEWTPLWIVTVAGSVAGAAQCILSAPLDNVRLVLASHRGGGAGNDGGRHRRGRHHSHGRALISWRSVMKAAILPFAPLASQHRRLVKSVQNQRPLFPPLRRVLSMSWWKQRGGEPLLDKQRRKVLQQTLRHWSGGVHGSGLLMSLARDSVGFASFFFIFEVSRRCAHGTSLFVDRSIAWWNAGATIWPRGGNSDVAVRRHDNDDGVTATADATAATAVVFDDDPGDAAAAPRRYSNVDFSYNASRTKTGRVIAAFVLLVGGAVGAFAYEWVGRPFELMRVVIWQARREWEQRQQRERHRTQRVVRGGRSERHVRSVGSDDGRRAGLVLGPASVARRRRVDAVRRRHREAVVGTEAESGGGRCQGQETAAAASTVSSGGASTESSVATSVGTSTASPAGTSTIPSGQTSTTSSGETLSISSASTPPPRRSRLPNPASYSSSSSRLESLLTLRAANSMGTRLSRLGSLMNANHPPHPLRAIGKAVRVGSRKNRGGDAVNVGKKTEGRGAGSNGSDAALDASPSDGGTDGSPRIQDRTSASRKRSTATHSSPSPPPPPPLPPSALSILLRHAEQTSTLAYTSSSRQFRTAVPAPVLLLHTYFIAPYLANASGGGAMTGAGSSATESLPSSSSSPSPSSTGKLLSASTSQRQPSTTTQSAARLLTRWTHRNPVSATFALPGSGGGGSAKERASANASASATGTVGQSTKPSTPSSSTPSSSTPSSSTPSSSTPSSSTPSSSTPSSTSSRAPSSSSSSSSSSARTYLPPRPASAPRNPLANFGTGRVAWALRRLASPYGIGFVAFAWMSGDV